MLYYRYKIQRKRKGNPREIEERKATGLCSRIFILYYSFCFRAKSERKVSRAAETVTEKRNMKSYGFFIQSLINTFKKSLGSLMPVNIGGQSIVEYNLVFIAFMLAVILVLGAKGEKIRGAFEGARDTAVERIKR
jgi:hypothetical protein